jgi:hypothetical protein
MDFVLELAEPPVLSSEVTKDFVVTEALVGMITVGFGIR